MKTPIYQGLAQGDIDFAGHDALNVGNWPAPGGGEGGGFRFDVTQYGAIGDGVTDDTTAIQEALAAIPATGGLLYFPAGRYKYTGATLALNKPVTVMGDGGAIGGLSLLLTMADMTPAISTIEFNSATLPLFNVTVDKCQFKDIELLNTSSTTPSAGAGVLVSDKGDFTWFVGVTVSGFYVNVDVQEGASLLWDHCVIIDPVLYGLRVINTLNPDLGDHCISNCWFYAGASNPTAALTGTLIGMKVINTKFNAGLGGYYVDMISLVGGGTSDLLITNCSFENFTGTAIKGRNVTAQPYYNTVITGNQIAPLVGGQIGIDFDGDFRNVTLTGNFGGTGSSPQAFIKLVGCGNIALSGNSAVGFASVISIGAGCSFAEAPVYIGLDARLVSIAGGAKLQVRNPGTGAWADGDQWTNP